MLRYVFNFTICIFFIIRIYLCLVFRQKHPHRSASQYSLFYQPLHEFCIPSSYKQGFVSLNSTFLFSFSITAKSPAFTSVNINCCEPSAFILIIYIPTYLNGLSEVRSVILFLAVALDEFKPLFFSQRADNRQR